MLRSSYTSFIFSIAIAAMIIALNFFSFERFTGSILSSVYTLTAIFGQIALLVILFGAATLIALSLFGQKIKRILFPLVMSIPLLVLFVDTQVFAQYKFHIQWVFVEMILSGGMVEFTHTNMLQAIFGVVLFVGLSFTLFALVQKLPCRQHCNRCFLALFFFAILFTHLAHIWANANAVTSITSVTRALPLFYPSTANRLLRKFGLVNEEHLRLQEKARLSANTNLNYPLNPIELNSASTAKKDIVLIAIESWRQDAFNPQTSPNIWHFAQQGRIFNNHYSTGNATRAGIFGLFYGLPSTYWHSFYQERRSPVLIDTLQQQGYQLGIFSAAHLVRPEFDQTIFVNVDNLRLRSKAESSYGRDIEITEEWQQWFASRDQSQPSFSFLFFDSLHGFSFPDDYLPRFEPMAKEIDYSKLHNDLDPAPIINRYKTSAHFIDSLVGRVLQAIDENTLVIITGDHGQEINDNKNNYWGHNGNFTDAQVKVPMVIFGKEVAQGIENIATSHMDLAPTLLSQFLTVKNPIADYSTGVNMLEPRPRKNILLASYNQYAIVSDKVITTINTNTGQYQVYDKAYSELDAKPNYDDISQAMQAMRTFLK